MAFETIVYIVLTFKFLVFNFYNRVTFVHFSGGCRSAHLRHPGGLSYPQTSLRLNKAKRTFGWAPSQTYRFLSCTYS